MGAACDSIRRGQRAGKANSCQACSLNCLEAVTADLVSPGLKCRSRPLSDRLRATADSPVKVSLSVFPMCRSKR